MNEKNHNKDKNSFEDIKILPKKTTEKSFLFFFFLFFSLFHFSTLTTVVLYFQYKQFKTRSRLSLSHNSVFIFT
jgi:hypothetical protein